MSYEDHSEVEFVLDGKLFHYDGNNVSLRWNPDGIINPDIVSPTAYSVDVEIYWFDAKNQSWYFFQYLANDLINNGIAENLSDIHTGPENQEYIVPIVFRIVPNAESTSAIPDYLLPFIQQREIGIWSSSASKVTKRDQEELVPRLCRDWIAKQNRSSGDILSSVIPCPCNLRQARSINSGFFELTGQRHALMRSVFNPGAKTCFASTSLGYVLNNKGQSAANLYGHCTLPLCNTMPIRFHLSGIVAYSHPF